MTIHSYDSRVANKLADDLMQSINTELNKKDKTVVWYDIYIFSQCRILYILCGG